MLFLLDLPPEEYARCDKDTLARTVTELLRANDRGHHIVVIDRRGVEWLTSHLSLNDWESASLRRIELAYSQRGGLATEARIYVKLTIDDNGIERSKEQTAFRRSFKTILLGNYLNPSQLFVEDGIHDGDMYKFIMENLADRFNVPYVKLEVLHGGGDRTSSMAIERAKDSYVVACIVDSDRRAPTQPEPSKVRSARASPKVAGSLFIIEATPCRELENMLPLELLQNLQSFIKNPTGGYLRRIDEYELTHNLEEKFYFYFDLKEGITPPNAETKGKSHSDGWLATRLESALGGSVASLVGFGPNIISQIINSNKLCSDLRPLIRSPSWIAVFGSFIRSLIWIFSATRPVVT
ncbi:hypothetical protein [Inquilinus sp. OTU3971]|uniref:hypothetical protein n=1 Tax=Inquilinus sp. OTU3971 TaxID=3043855 RepID=UPI00313E31FA